MTDLVKRLEEAIEDHRTSCVVMAIKASHSDSDGEKIRAALDEADTKLLDTILAALSGDGMVMVPREPTEEMLLALGKYDKPERMTAAARNILLLRYQDMIAASPALTNDKEG